MLANRLIWYMKDQLEFAGRVGLTCKRMHAALLVPTSPFWQIYWHQILGMKARRTKTARKCVLAKRMKRYEKRYGCLTDTFRLSALPYAVIEWFRAFRPFNSSFLVPYNRLEVQRAEIGVLEAKIAKMQEKLRWMRERQEEDERIWRVMK